MEGPQKMGLRTGRCVVRIRFFSLPCVLACCCCLLLLLLLLLLATRGDWTLRPSTLNPNVNLNSLQAGGPNRERS